MPAKLPAPGRKMVINYGGPDFKDDMSLTSEITGVCGGVIGANR